MLGNIPLRAVGKLAIFGILGLIFSGLAEEATGEMICEITENRMKKKQAELEEHKENSDEEAAEEK